MFFRFPTWSEGHWEDLYIDSNTLVFQDRRNFKVKQGFQISKERNKTGFSKVLIIWKNGAQKLSKDFRSIVSSITVPNVLRIYFLCYEIYL